MREWIYVALGICDVWMSVPWSMCLCPSWYSPDWRVSFLVLFLARVQRQRMGMQIWSIGRVSFAEDWEMTRGGTRLDGCGAEWGMVESGRTVGIWQVWRMTVISDV